MINLEVLNCHLKNRGKMVKNSLVTVEQITGKIYHIRGIKVMLDRDLAMLYEVETRVLNQAGKTFP